MEEDLEDCTLTLRSKSMQLKGSLTLRNLFFLQVEDKATFVKMHLFGKSFLQLSSRNSSSEENKLIVLRLSFFPEIIRFLQMIYYANYYSELERKCDNLMRRMLVGLTI